MVNSDGRSHRLNPVRRQEERVTALELFFDLVFVLAITQCTALMAAEPTWEGLAKGLVVLGVLWWAWIAYSWLTSVVDPEEGTARLVIFAAMGAMLICALCVPEVFEDLGLTFAIAYGLFERPTSPSSSSPVGTPRTSDVQPSAWASEPQWVSPSWCWPRSSTAPRRVPSGCWRSPSTWASRSSSAPQDGGWYRTTSPSATASSSSSPWASRSSPSASVPSTA